MKLSRSARGAALALIGALTLAGCASGGSGAGSGDTIKVMSWAPMASPKIAEPELKTVAEARVKAINDAGGINGHRLELIFCDTNYDPNVEASCARQAQEQKVAAVVAGFTTFASTFGVLERSKIPLVGGFGLTPQELASPVVYPLSGGVPGWYAGAVAQLKDAGAHKIGLITCSSPACSYAITIVEDSVKRSGLQLTSQAKIQSGTPDPSAGVAQAVAGAPDGLVIAVPSGDVPKVVQAVRRANYTGRVSSASGVFPAAALKALGADANGILLSSQVKPISLSGDQAIRQFSQEMDAVDSSADKSENAELAWGGWFLFEQLAKRLGSVDADSVSAALTNLSQPIDTGVAGEYSTAGKVSPMASASRLFNPSVYYAKIDNGTLVATASTPENPFTQLAGS